MSSYSSTTTTTTNSIGGMNGNSEKEGWFEDSWSDELGDDHSRQTSVVIPLQIQNEDAIPDVSSPSEVGGWNLMFAIGKKIFEKARETSGFESSTISSTASFLKPLLPKNREEERNVNKPVCGFEPSYYWNVEDVEEEEDDDDDDDGDHEPYFNDRIAESQLQQSNITHKIVISRKSRNENSSSGNSAFHDSFFDIQETNGSNAFDGNVKLFNNENENYIDGESRIDSFKEAVIKNSDAWSWRHVALEVIPVLAIVALGVLGTFSYLYITGRSTSIWPKEKEAFSLSCSVDHGRWREEPSGKEFYSKSCPYLRDQWNCKKFGLHSGQSAAQFRWAPHQCELPRFDSQSFLQTMSGKKLAFIGDTSAANEFDSLTCMLAETDVPLLLENGILMHPPPPLFQDLDSGIKFDAVVQHDDVEIRENSQISFGFVNDGKIIDSVSMHSKAQNHGAADERNKNGGNKSGNGELDKEEEYWSRKRKVVSYFFSRFNFTLSLFDSPLLVNVKKAVKVNRTACQQSKERIAYLLSKAESLGIVSPLHTDADDDSGIIKFTSYRSEKIRNVNNVKTKDADNLTAGSSSGGVEGVEYANGKSMERAYQQNRELVETDREENESNRAKIRSELNIASERVYSFCYPNRIVLNEPDPIWSKQIKDYDILVMNSGEEWQEEIMEDEGFSIFNNGERKERMSMERLYGDEWAYPIALKNIISWLNNRDSVNSSNFDGHVVFRSFAPSHRRKECAARVLLEDDDLRAAVTDDFQLYDKAASEALEGNEKFMLLNISVLSARRADGHPWKSYSMDPKPDCSHWCLPGIPDTWNEILSAMLTQLYSESSSQSISGTHDQSLSEHAP